MRKFVTIAGLGVLIAAAGTAFALRAIPQAGSQAPAVVTPGAAQVAAVGTGTASGGCGGACCGGAAATQGIAPTRVEALRNYLQSYYARSLNDPAVRVEVRDLGCHQEADVVRGGEVVKKLSIRGSQITEIG